MCGLPLSSVLLLQSSCAGCICLPFCCLYSPCVGCYAVPCSVYHSLPVWVASVFRSVDCILPMWVVVQEALLGGWDGGESGRGKVVSRSTTRFGGSTLASSSLCPTLSLTFSPTPSSKFSFTTASSSIYISPTSPLPSPSLSFLYSSLCLVAPAFLCGLPLSSVQLLVASMCGCYAVLCSVDCSFLCGMSCRRLCRAVGVGRAAKFCCDVLHL